MNQEALQKQFKRLRARTGMTQEEVASALGYASGMVISHKECGTRTINRRDILALKQIVQKGKKK